MKQIYHIETNQELLKLCKEFNQNQWLAIDTEFVREKTYYPQLGLIQISNGEIAATIDPLNIDLAPLKKLFFNPHIIKVFHSARQDLEIFYLLWNKVPFPIFDTQISALLLGYPDQTGYANCVATELNVHLKKAHTRANWLQRPLSQAMLEYALEDVIYLSKIYLIFKEKLLEKKQLSWLSDDFTDLSQNDLYQVNLETIWTKVKGRQILSPRQLALLQKLACWREQQAIKKNKPRKWILSDPQLLNLSKTLFNNTEGSPIEFISFTNEVKQIPTPDLPYETIFKKLNQNQNQKVKELIKTMKKIEQQAHLTQGILASKTTITRFIQGEKHIPFLKGWRKEIIASLK